MYVTFRLTSIALAISKHPMRLPCVVRASLMSPLYCRWRGYVVYSSYRVCGGPLCAILALKHECVLPTVLARVAGCAHHQGTRGCVRGCGLAPARGEQGGHVRLGWTHQVLGLSLAWVLKRPSGLDGLVQPTDRHMRLGKAHQLLGLEFAVLGY